MIYFAPLEFYWSTSPDILGSDWTMGRQGRQCEGPLISLCPNIWTFLCLLAEWSERVSRDGLLGPTSHLSPDTGPPSAIITGPGPWAQFFPAPTRDQIILHSHHNYQEDNRDRERRQSRCHDLPASPTVRASRPTPTLPWLPWPSTTAPRGCCPSPRSTSSSWRGFHITGRTHRGGKTPWDIISASMTASSRFLGDQTGRARAPTGHSILKPSRCLRMVLCSGGGRGSGSRERRRKNWMQSWAQSQT